jgi:hypothetical protein
MAKYKVGDTVRIRSKAWIDAQDKNELGSIENDVPFFKGMFIYAGKEAVIVGVNCDGMYKISLDDESYWWEDWMFEDPTETGVLSPKEAVKAMLNGEVLVDKHGNEYRWSDEKQDFCLRPIGTAGTDIRKGDWPPGFFFGLRHITAKRPATRWEWMHWANTRASRGWLVRVSENSDWYLPQGISYGGCVDTYQRARILPDLSGVDESTIQGFEVEETQ